MTKRPVRWTSPALRDLGGITRYLSKENPDAATKLITEVDRTIALLATFPLLGREVKDERLGRYRLVPIWDYLIFYIVTENEVQIRRVLHGARQYEHLLEPLGELVVHEGRGRY